MVDLENKAPFMWRGVPSQGCFLLCPNEVLGALRTQKSVLDAPDLAETAKLTGKVPGRESQGQAKGESGILWLWSAHTSVAQSMCGLNQLVGRLQANHFSIHSAELNILLCLRKKKRINTGRCCSISVKIAWNKAITHSKVKFR